MEDSFKSAESIARFEEDFAKRSQARAKAKARRRERDGCDFEACDGIERLVEVAIVRRDIIARRLAIGFEWRGGFVGDHFVHPFVEAGLRSNDEDAHVLRRFVAATPKPRRGDGGLMCGPTKGQLLSADAKILGLDEAYFELNRTMRIGWRIDLDADFASWDALRTGLESLVAQRRLPCLPHAAVGRSCPTTGKITHPHLWWLLPYGAAVWFDEADPRCNPKQIAFFKGVVGGCTAVLLELGADPTACLLPLKGKSPLSPVWDSVIWNQTDFPTLADWARHVDTRAKLSTLSRAAAQRDSGLSGAGSNGTFLALQRLAFDALRAMAEVGDPDYLAALDDRPALSRLLINRSRHDVAATAATREDRKRAFAIFIHVARYAAEAWNPKPNCRAVDRGACAADVEGLPKHARQRVGALYAAAVKSETTRRRIRDAYQGLANIGAGTPTPACVAGFLKLTDRPLSEKTVRRQWLAAIGDIASGH
ncbi:hypothetical protein CCR94_10820 [Rhodoblastus sphagnicola]|uniref:Uncharacterized protein n=1 Tax=Rhodoblastus sphagnicola TaxID=333368 RepID=A0A2S6N8M5_9HYPH|nr:hypothetical protein [Rhodoblastus sphagnicola]MBB4199944.1 hypothetical protein [Rhodoblastus sphagnicola]PPQ30965.1 hypothetical protein CCR94_10820 [Rhodoblastus sphagnicola]